MAKESKTPPPGNPPERPQSPAGSGQAPGSAQRAGEVRHDSRGHAVWQWTAETARNVALTTSQVLRRLDSDALQLKDDTLPGRGKGAATTDKMPGGAFDPYESRPAARPPAPTGGGAAAPKPTAPAPRPAPAPPPKAAAPPVPAPWWRRLFGRD